MPRTDTATRTIAAPSERVYAALSDPDALTVWLPPAGMSGEFERSDFRVGGSYRMTLTYDDSAAGQGKTTSDTDIVEARYIAIAPGHRVVQAIDFNSDDPDLAGTMTMTWEVLPAEASAASPGSHACRVTVRAENVPTGISAAEHAVGLASSLANLAAYVEAQI